MRSSRRIRRWPPSSATSTRRPESPTSGTVRCRAVTTYSSTAPDRRPAPMRGPGCPVSGEPWRIVYDAFTPSMGIFRFLLAALVVLFHFGGLSWIVGRIAVYAFYCISGFLIFQVLDRVYLNEPRGPGRFLTNRFVRLAPLYVAYAVLTTAALVYGGDSFQRALTLAG